MAESVIKFICCGKGKAPVSWTFNHYPYVNRLYYIYGGTAYYTVEGQRHPFLPGHLYLFSYGTPFSAEHDPCDPMDHLYFDFSIVPPIFLEGFIEFCVEAPSAFHHLIKAMELLFENEEQKAEPEMLKSLFSVLFSWLCKEFGVRRLKDTRLNDTLEYIHSHYSEEITNEALARRVHLDRRHFLRIFKKDLNMTPGKYLQEYRLNIAASLLRSGIPVHEAAEKTGYENNGSLCNAFKKSRGVSPSAFRKSMKL